MDFLKPPMEHRPEDMQVCMASQFKVSKLIPFLQLKKYAFKTAKDTMESCITYCCKKKYNGYMDQLASSVPQLIRCHFVD